MKVLRFLLFVSASVSIGFVSCSKDQSISSISALEQERSSTAVNELVANGDTISLFDNIPVYGIYRYPVVQDTLPAGIERLSNPAVARLINISPILKNYKKGMQLVLTLYGQEDFYDRLAYVYFSDKKPVADGPDQGIKTNSGIEAMRFITPFFSNTTNPSQKTFVSDVTDITDLLPYINKSNVWVAVQIDNNPEYRIANKAGFTFSLSIVKTDTEPSSKYIQPLFKTSMTSKQYEYAFQTTKALTGARIYITTSGHGAASGGEEYAHRRHDIYLDGLLTEAIATEKNCASYQKYSPLGNPGIFIGNGSFNPRNWCPGEVLPRYSVYVGDLAPGNHTLKIDVPSADFGSPGDNIIVSSYLTAD